MRQVCSPFLVQCIGLFIAIVVAFFIIELLRRSKRYAFLLMGLPLFLTPLWISRVDQDWFFWAKIYTMYLTTLWLLLCRFTKFEKYVRWMILLVYINILEAVYRGFLIDRYWCLLACASAVLLMITLPFNAFSIDKKGPYRDLLFDVPWGWIIGYNLWQEAYFAGVFPGTIVRLQSSVIVPLLVAIFFGRKLWAQARIFSLTLLITFAFTFPEWAAWLYGPCSSIKFMEIGFSLASFLWMCAYAIFYFKDWISERH